MTMEPEKLKKNVFDLLHMMNNVPYNLRYGHGSQNGRIQDRFDPIGNKKMQTTEMENYWIKNSFIEPKPVIDDGKYQVIKSSSQLGSTYSIFSPPCKNLFNLEKFQLCNTADMG